MVNLTDLPNELITHILSYLPSVIVLKFLQVSRRIHNLSVHILLRRIHNAYILDNHHLIFECYPPSAITTTPSLHCAYLGTWSLPSTYTHPDQNPSPSCPPGQTKRLQNPGLRYSHFLPTSAPLASTHPSQALQLPETLIPVDLSLDTNTLFTLLTAQAFLVKVGPRWGLFNSVVEVFEKKGMRVHRIWLKKAENATNKEFGKDGELSVRGGGGKKKTEWEEAILEEELEGEGEIDKSSEGGDEDNDRILWFGETKVAGIKLRVRERKFLRQNDQQQPLLMAADEEPAATYSLYYESLMIRTVHLLYLLDQVHSEEEIAQGGIGSGMAIVIANARGPRPPVAGTSSSS